MKNNNFLIFIPLLLMGSTVSKSSESKKINLSDSITHLLDNVSNSLTIDDVTQSVDTLRKIGPYLPEPYVGKVNSFVFNFEKASKVTELVSFLSSNKPSNPVASAQNISSKDRFNRILLALKDDIPNDKIKNIKPFIDIIANFDKYKSMIGMISTLNNDSQKPEDKMENMLNMVMPLLGQNEESAEKMKDMMQIFQALNTISSEDESSQSQASEYDSEEHEKVYKEED